MRRLRPKIASLQGLIRPFNFSESALSASLVLTHGLIPTLITVQFRYGVTTSSTLFYRMTLSLILLGIIFIRQKISLKIPLVLAAKFVLASFLMAASLLFFGASLSRTNVATSSGLNHSFPLFINVLMAVICRQAISRSRLTAMLFILAGMAPLFVVAYQQGDLSAYGSTLALLSAIVGSIAMITMECLEIRATDPLVHTFYMNAGIAFFVLIYNLIFSAQRAITSWPSLGLIVLFTLLNPMLSVPLFHKSVAVLGSNRTAVRTSIEPFFAYLFVVIILRQPFAWLLLLGVVLISLGKLIANTSFFRRD